MRDKGSTDPDILYVDSKHTGDADDVDTTFRLSRAEVLQGRVGEVLGAGRTELTQMLADPGLGWVWLGKGGQLVQRPDIEQVLAEGTPDKVIWLGPRGAPWPVWVTTETLRRYWLETQALSVAIFDLTDSGSATIDLGGVGRSARPLDPDSGVYVMDDIPLALDRIDRLEEHDSV